MSRTIVNSLGALAGHCLDKILGEPPTAVHPVVWLGNGLTQLEKQTYRDTKLAGTIHLGIALLGSATLGQVANRTVGRFAATAICTGGACAGRMLGRSAQEIGSQLEVDDLDAARAALPALVGRDPSGLDTKQIARAVIESVAENTVDAVTATLLLAQAGGSTGVLVHRTVNTLDAMVGHRSDRYRNFGWASARFDDALAWIPARVTLLGIAAVRPRSARSIIATARRDASLHPSPNGGVVEAGFAAALGVQLGGSNVYDGIVEDRGLLGDGSAPIPSDIHRAVQLADHVSILLSALPALVLVATKVGSRKANT